MKTRTTLGEIAPRPARYRVRLLTAILWAARRLLYRTSSPMSRRNREIADRVILDSLLSMPTQPRRLTLFLKSRLLKGFLTKLVDESGALI
jgi:hypothetical protein